MLSSLGYLAACRVFWLRASTPAFPGCPAFAHLPLACLTCRTPARRGRFPPRIARRLSYLLEKVHRLTCFVNLLLDQPSRTTHSVEICTLKCVSKSCENGLGHTRQCVDPGSLAAIRVRTLSPATLTRGSHSVSQFQFVPVSAPVRSKSVSVVLRASSPSSTTKQASLSDK